MSDEATVGEKRKRVPDAEDSSDGSTSDASSSSASSREHKRKKKKKHKKEKKSKKHKSKKKSKKRKKSEHDDRPVQLSKFVYGAEDDDEVRVSVISGKPIKLHRPKTREDKSDEKARERMRQWMNSAAAF